MHRKHESEQGAARKHEQASQGILQPVRPSNEQQPHRDRRRDGLLNRSSPGIARPLQFIVVELAILFNGRLGWMERSDPRQFRFVVVLGFAGA
jgi:hypothetical protein